MSASLPRVGEWLQQRFPVEQELLVRAGSEPIPGHLNRWWWCIGGTPAYLFVVQVISGILLTFYYVPSPDHAYESVQAITTDIRFGWFIRSVHRWASHLMIVAVLLHMTRVFFTGRLSCSSRRQLDDRVPDSLDYPWHGIHRLLPGLGAAFILGGDRGGQYSRRGSSCG